MYTLKAGETGRGEGRGYSKKSEMDWAESHYKEIHFYYNSGGEDLPAVLKADRRKRALCTLYDFYLGRKRT
jgi:hypothetical protein